MVIVPIYRISDGGNREKIKPGYATKEQCLLNFIREFGVDNLYIICDNVTQETFEMVKSHVPPERVSIGSNGNTGAFMASLSLAKAMLDNTPEQQWEEVYFYFVEDDYIHRRGAQNVLVDAFLNLNAEYVSLYDHPDKYQDNKSPEFIDGHGRVDVVRDDGFRMPGAVYPEKASETRLFASKLCHWREVGSTTMTWAVPATVLLEDLYDIMEVHFQKPLPMGGTNFQMLRDKGRTLITPLPAFSTHAEERWMSYYVDWEKEATVGLPTRQTKSGEAFEDVWFDELERQLEYAPTVRLPKRRKQMWEEFIPENTLPGGEIAEFGVASGGSIGWFPKHLPGVKVYGFDSFEGLPEHWDLGEKVLEKGHFSSDGAVPFEHKDIEYRVGLFEETVPEWRNEMLDQDRYLKIVHMDADLYSSTSYVLDQIKPLLRSGTLILFDELTHFPDHPQYKANRMHEYKAFMEFCEKNPSFKFNVIARTEICQVIVQVEAI